MNEVKPYKPKHHVRIVTAASLFDGHDAAINIMRRIIQSTGAEVIHLGHDRSVQEIVDTAIQEDAQAIAVTSYQGGHMEYFKYMKDLLRERGADHIKIFGGGGGTILPDEIAELHKYGITRIYAPDDGRSMGLQGMINELVQESDYEVAAKLNGEASLIGKRDHKAIARLITIAENNGGVTPLLGRGARSEGLRTPSEGEAKTGEATTVIPVLGITGTGGSGKSSLVDELVRRFLIDFAESGIASADRNRPRNDSRGGKTVAIISVDPSKRKTGGALLGDRIRMNSVYDSRVYMRSLATRQANLALSSHVKDAISILKAAQFDLIILETSGIGQSDTEIVDHSDLALYVMTPEYGAASQLEKIDMLDFADIVALNKFDKRGAMDALRDVKKQFKRNHQLFTTPDEEIPVFGTIASQFNDPGVNNLYKALMDKIVEKTGADLKSDFHETEEMSEKIYIIPPKRVRYLSEISENNRAYDKWVDEQCDIAEKMFGLNEAIKLFGGEEQLQGARGKEQGASEVQLETRNSKLETEALIAKFDELRKQLDPRNWELLKTWPDKARALHADDYTYHVRGKAITVKTFTESLSHTKIPKLAVPKYRNWGDILRWQLQENLPGTFPYTAGVYPFKRELEDPTRMFAGEGGPERTNKRFHYVSLGLPAKRLSTAFDSVTLYGRDPDYRPDIYGKVGNSGVSICCLDDAKKLYSGFNLCDSATSVSMTINGPASIITAFYMNAAIDQQCELYIKEHGLEKEVEKKFKELYDDRGLPRPTYNSLSLRGSGADEAIPNTSATPQPLKGISPPPSGGGREGATLPEGNNGLGLMLLGLTGDQVLDKETYETIKAHALHTTRGTVQADILKEDQAQNTCIFSTEFSLKLMGDVQEYFNRNKVRNFYSVSISGYHIAEAGANPISQLAFTLANGFTYVEYYLSRGMKVDDFAPNLSFFFSNGIDPEYAVIGRVARRIWAKAMREKYGANERSQMLKYHIQTSGRSLHAQEISFNDIRTTLQALYAIYDNCNSLHTNAYDEAITTPTEESVRRAMAIQLIINHELGLAKNQNPLQGSFIIEELTDLVEEAVLLEFDNITERGGVLGAMETMYQRGKIQEESLYYESLKHSGKLPIMGVNTFLSKDGSPTVLPREVIRATGEEKENQIQTLTNLHKSQRDKSPNALREVQKAALHNENIFSALMDAVKCCSLGQITNALFEVGGQYRRNM